MIMILQKSIPFDASSDKPLPGISPLDPDEWLMIDDVYGAQMALRQELITTKRDQVIAIDLAALPAARELLGQVLDYFSRTGAMQMVDGVVQTPDGRRVPVNYDDPMGCMGQIAQNDFAIMEQRGEEHVLTAAALCFRPVGCWRKNLCGVWLIFMVLLIPMTIKSQNACNACLMGYRWIAHCGGLMPCAMQIPPCFNRAACMPAARARNATPHAIYAANVKP